MSYDFRTLRPCKHRVERAQAVLSVDGLGLVFDDDVASTSSVKLYYDGTEVPRDGLYSTPQHLIKSKLSYRFTSSCNKFKIKVSGSPERVVQLPIKTMLTADLYSVLRSNLSDILSVSLVDNGILLKSKSINQSIAFIDPRSTDKGELFDITKNMLCTLNTIGVTPGRVAKRKLIVPGWDAVKSPSNVSVHTYMLMFRSTFKSKSALFELSYNTTPSSCRRCYGLGYEFDYGRQNDSYETVNGRNLLVQEFDKFLYTKYGSHFKWRWFGTQILDRIGAKSVGYMIQSDVNKAFDIYKDIKTQQMHSFLFQNVSDAEFPQNLDDISVSIDPNDPTITKLNIVVSNSTYESIDLYKQINSNLGVVMYDNSYLLRG